MGATETVRELAGRVRPGRDAPRGTPPDAEDLGRRAAARAGEVLDGAETVVDAADPGLRRAGDAIGRMLRAATRLAAVVPAMLARVLELVSRVLSRFAETGREVADHVEPPRRHRRRRRLVLAGWFAGGFAAGVATGWILHEQIGDDAVVRGGPTGAVPDPTDERTAAVDARRAGR